VQREINTTSSVGCTGLTPLFILEEQILRGYGSNNPFAGDDAE
jgi:prenylated cyclic peptide (anacyclamide/piricyclamide family)